MLCKPQRHHLPHQVKQCHPMPRDATRRCATQRDAARYCDVRQCKVVRCETTRYDMIQDDTSGQEVCFDKCVDDRLSEGRETALDSLLNMFKQAAPAPDQQSQHRMALPAPRPHLHIARRLVPRSATLSIDPDPGSLNLNVKSIIAVLGDERLGALSRSYGARHVWNPPHSAPQVEEGFRFHHLVPETAKARQRISRSLPTYHA